MGRGAGRCAKLDQIGKCRRLGSGLDGRRFRHLFRGRRRRSFRFAFRCGARCTGSAGAGYRVCTGHGAGGVCAGARTDADATSVGTGGFGLATDKRRINAVGVKTSPA